MRDYAYIYNGAVAQVLILEDEQDITQMFHPDLLWIEITNLVPKPKEGWLYDGSSFSEPPPIYIDPRPALYAELEQIDRESARPLRAMVIADPNIGIGSPERTELENLEARASAIRAQLEELEP